MKKQVIQYVQSLGEKAYYSGKQKTLFVTDRWINWDMPSQTVEGAILQKFGYGLKFKLQTN